MQLRWTRSVLWPAVLVSVMGAMRPQAAPTAVDVQLVLASLARGAYQLRVTATDGASTDSRSIGLAVK